MSLSGCFALTVASSHTALWKTGVSLLTGKNALRQLLEQPLTLSSTTALLFDPATSADSYRNRVAYVVAHELAHQWFGNLVTMDWWNELWLNEGFATWVGWLAIDHLYPGMYNYIL